MSTPTDTNRLTEAELARLEELLAKATAGPWQWHLSHDGLSLRTPNRGQLIIMDVGRTGDIRFAKRTERDRGGLLCDPKEFLPQPMRVGFCTLDNPDASLIPAAVNAFPALLATARDYARLEAENERWQEINRDELGETFRLMEALGVADEVRDGKPCMDAMLAKIAAITSQRDAANRQVATLQAERDRLVEVLRDVVDAAHLRTHGFEADGDISDLDFSKMGPAIMRADKLLKEGT